MAASRTDAVVRTVTCFVTLEAAGPGQWRTALAGAATALQTAKTELGAAGYAVQTCRIVTNPFREFLDCGGEGEALVTQLEALEAAKPAFDGRLLYHLGDVDRANLRHVVLLVERFGYSTCANIGVDEQQVVDRAFADEAAAVVCALSRSDKPCLNFSFTVNFNCPPRIPYFPAAYNTSGAERPALAAGLQMVDLFADAIQSCAPGKPAVADAFPTRAAAWRAASGAMTEALRNVTASVAAVCEGVCATHKMDFAGIDTSPAPATNMGSKSIVDLYRLLGVRDFGLPGTVEASALLTRVCKSVPHVGFSGLMLPPTEDAGLAAAVGKGLYNVHNLLTYSAVCGIGLDTVPVPGDTSAASIASLFGDVGALAFRLDKPLTARLFPVQGLAAGAVCSFDSPVLCDCPVFAVNH